MAPNQPISIPYENGDDLVHTDEKPYCSDISCPCHSDPAYIAMRDEELQDELSAIWASLHEVQ